MTIELPESGPSLLAAPGPGTVKAAGSPMTGRYRPEIGRSSQFIHAEKHPRMIGITQVAR